ncbi:MAG: hypothetical protein QW379_02120 [Thermoplasmata archaeon]
MFGKGSDSYRALPSVFLALLLFAPAATAGGDRNSEEIREGPRAVTNDANDLIVPEGEVYNLSGSHIYARSVQINGTLRINPYDGNDESTGLLSLQAPWIIVGPNGKILGDGRGYGGGGGGQNSDKSVTGGRGGTGGKGGAGQDSYWGGTWQVGYACGGGGGSNGGAGGKPGGSPGTESGGGSGGTGSWAGGAGGTGFGGGGGGGSGGDGSITYSGAGGGGGGGCGGADASWTSGGKGAGPYGGNGGAGVQSGPPGNDGENGGYMKKGANGDTTTDISVVRGSGGGGGGTSADPSYGGGGGGGGAGGAAVRLISSGELVVHGVITCTGGGGGAGGQGGKTKGGNGGGGAGGGIALAGSRVVIKGTLDARGREFNSLSLVNGGTVKIFYMEKDTAGGVILAGRTYTNGRPVMQELSSPPDGSAVNAPPLLKWAPASDPEGESVTYTVQVSSGSDFSTIVNEESDLAGTEYSLSGSLADGVYYWRVRASDSFGPGRWSEVWKFTIDTVPPSSSVAALPEFTTSPSFYVNWSGADDRSGVAGYTIFVMDDTGASTPWLVGTLQTSARFTGKDGTGYRFYSVAVDGAGNTELPPALPDAETVVDTTPPESRILSLDPFQNSEKFTVRWSGTDATSGVATYNVFVSVDGGEFEPALENSTASSLEFTGANGHHYTFFVRARDRAGNYEPRPTPEKHVSTRVDLLAPLTCATVGAPKYGDEPVFITTSTQIGLSASDEVAGVEAIFYQLDDAGVERYRAPLSSLPPGSHNLTYWSVDRAGNEDQKRTVRFFVDVSPPQTVIDFDGPSWVCGSTVYISNATRIVLSAYDAGSGVALTEFALESGDYERYTGPISLTRAGTHTLHFRSMDNLGLVEDERVQNLVLDLAPPVTGSNAPSGPQNRDTTVVFRAEDPESGVAGTLYRVLRDGRELVPWTNGTALTVLAPADHSGDGCYTIEFYSVDNVGNSEVAKSVVVRIDTVCELVLDAKSGMKLKSTRYTLSGRTEPGGSVTVNGARASVNTDGSFSVELKLREGRNKISVKATDGANNTMIEEMEIATEKIERGVTLPVLGVAVAVVAAAALAGSVFVLKTRKK